MLGIIATIGVIALTIGCLVICTLAAIG